MSLACPLCGCKMSFVQRTYPVNVMIIRGKKITTIKRRRVCRHCGQGRYTIERNEEDIMSDEDRMAEKFNERQPPPNPFLP